MIRACAAIVIGICVIFIVALFSIDAIIEKKIRSQFGELSPALQIKFSGVRSRIFSSSVSFDSLQISFTPYIDHQEEQHIFLFTKVSLQGIHFLNFLFHKKLVARDLSLTGGDIRLSRSLLDTKDSVQMQAIRGIKWPFRTLSLDRVQLKQSNIFLHSAQDDKLLARGNVSFRGVATDKPGGKPALSALDVDLADIDYPSMDSRIRIRRLQLSSTSKSVKIDSLQLSKNSKHNRAIIRSIKITGIEMSKLMDEQALICEKIKVADANVVASDDNVRALPDLKELHADVFEIHNSRFTYQTS